MDNQTSQLIQLNWQDQVRKYGALKKRATDLQDLKDARKLWGRSYWVDKWINNGIQLENRLIF